MTPEIFGEWLRCQGHHIIRTENSYWFNQGPRVLQAFPYHWLIEPTQEEINQLLRVNFSVGLRFSTKPASLRGTDSYHVVYENEDYPIEKLLKKARYDVRKGLSQADIKTLSFENLAMEGWKLRYDTLERQGRIKADTREKWELMCKSAYGLPGFEAWGAFVEGVLGASLIAFTCDDCCSILYQQSRTKYLSYGINNALVYEFTNAVIKRPEKPWIFYGLHSLDAPATVDEFKFRMGYTAKPVKQRVVFHPMIAPLFNPISYKMIKQLAVWQPHNPSLAKVVGMVRFYLEGRNPKPSPAKSVVKLNH